MLEIGKAKSLRPRVRSYFQQRRRHARPDRRARRAGRGHRGDRHRDRGGGAPRRAEPRQAAPPAVQHPAARRQVVPVHRGHGRGRVPARDVHARAAPSRGRHFGPYANAKKVRETLDVLNRVFQYRPCEGPKPGSHSGIPCLDYHIERCKAPCVGYIDKEAYREMIDRVIEFLSGETRPIQRELERPHAGGGDRGAVRGCSAVPEPAVCHSPPRGAAGGGPALGRYRGRARDRHRGRSGAVQIFPLPDGGSSTAGWAWRTWRGAISRPLKAFCLEYDGSAPTSRPSSRPAHAGNTAALEQFLSDRRGARVEVRAPARGEKRRLQDLADRTPASRWTPTCSSPSSAVCAASRRSRSCVKRSTWRACHCGSSATTSPTSRPSRRSARWSSSRTRSRRSPLPEVHSAEAQQDRTTRRAMAEVVSRRFAH